MKHSPKCHDTARDGEAYRDGRLDRKRQLPSHWHALAASHDVAASTQVGRNEATPESSTLPHTAAQDAPAGVGWASGQDKATRRAQARSQGVTGAAPAAPATDGTGAGGTGDGVHVAATKAAKIRLLMVHL